MDECTPCNDCKDTSFLTYWLTDNSLWRKIVGRQDIVLCPNCFTTRCIENGISIYFEAVRDDAV